MEPTNGASDQNRWREEALRLFPEILTVEIQSEQSEQNIRWRFRVSDEAGWGPGKSKHADWHWK